MSPANHSARPASERDSTIPETSGPPSPEPFAYFDLATSSLKTSQVTFDLGLSEPSVTLPKWGSMRGGGLYERRMPELPIGGNGSSALPTPRANKWGPPDSHGFVPDFLLKTPRASRGAASTENQNALIPTPQARDGDGRSAQGKRFVDPRRSNNLDEAWLLPTPNAIDSKATRSSKSKGGVNHLGDLVPGWGSTGAPTNPQSDDGSA